MSDFAGIIGIDVGSVSVSVSEISPSGELGQTQYASHGGEPKATLRQLLAEIPIEQGYVIAATSSTPSWVMAQQKTDNQVALIRACQRLYPSLSGILVVGGEKFGLIRFDDEGEYRDYRTNSSCAAGTGSFLDQQAQRLKLKDS